MSKSLTVVNDFAKHNSFNKLFFYNLKNFFNSLFLLICSAAMENKYGRTRRLAIKSEKKSGKGYGVTQTLCCNCLKPNSFNFLRKASRLNRSFSGMSKIKIR